MGFPSHFRSFSDAIRRLSDQVVDFVNDLDPSGFFLVFLYYNRFPLKILL